MYIKVKKLFMKIPNIILHQAEADKQDFQFTFYPKWRSVI
jgi:hypothetical protein